MARRELRAMAAAERRRSLLRLGLTRVLPLLLVLVLIGGLVSLLAGRGGDAPPAASGGRTQETLLLQVSGPGALGTAQVLLGRATAAPSTGAVGLLVPGDLVTDAPGLGDVPFAQTARAADPSIAGDALADQLGVAVDGVWRITAAGLAGLVDAVGGVTVDVDADVLDAQGTVVVPAGAGQRLDGAAAARFAAALAPREQEQARTARVGALLTAVLRAFPTDTAQARTVVEGLADRSASTWTAERTTAFLVAAATAADAEDLLLTNVPVTVIDTGGEAPSFRLDRAQARDLVQRVLPGAVPPGAGAEQVRVLVQNGVGTPGLGQRARARLVDAGYAFVNGGNAASFDRATTVVVIPDDTTAARTTGAAVAAALGLAPSAVRVAGQGQSVADVVVVLGSDFGS